MMVVGGRNVLRRVKRNGKLCGRGHRPDRREYVRGECPNSTLATSVDHMPVHDDVMRCWWCVSLLWYTDVASRRHDVSTGTASRRQDVSVLPQGIARSGHRVAMLSTLPGSRRTTGLGHHAVTADFPYQQPSNSTKFYPYHHHQQLKQRSDVSDAVDCGRFNSVTIPRRGVTVARHENGNGNSRSAVATDSPPETGSRARGRSRLTPAVSDLDIAGGSSHLSPYGGATDDKRHLETATHVGGIISTSLLALPDTSVWGSRLILVMGHSMFRIQHNRNAFVDKLSTSYLCCGCYILEI